MSREDFYIPLDKLFAEANVVKDVPRERAVRLYLQQSGKLWALQVRTPLKLRDQREGRDFIVATATLDRASMVALRDAIDRQLGDGGLWHGCTDERGHSFDMGVCTTCTFDLRTGKKQNEV